MAKRHSQTSLWAIEGVLKVFEATDPNGAPELHVVLDRFVDDLAEPLPAVVDGLPVRPKENKVVYLYDGRVVIADKDEQELEELQTEALVEQIETDGRAEDYLALVNHLVGSEASLPDIASVVESGLARHPDDGPLLLIATATGHALIEHGDTDGSIRLAKLIAKTAGMSHVKHYNAAQIYLRAGKRRKAQRHYEQALMYATNEEDRQDAVEGLERLEG